VNSLIEDFAPFEEQALPVLEAKFHIAIFPNVGDIARKAV
jgi:hypothetical protein